MLGTAAPRVPSPIQERAAMLEFRDLRWAIIAAQHRSLRQAANALNVRQSTLSRELRNLEHKLGATLFERTNGGTKPTIAGQEFLVAARRIVDDVDAMSCRLKTKSRGESGQLALGVQASLSAGNFRAALIEHRRAFPGVEIQLVDGSSDYLISDLRNAAVDIAFLVGDYPRWEGKSLAVWSERMVVAVPEEHRLAAQSNVHWDDLSGEPLIISQRGPGPEFLQVLFRKSPVADALQLVRHDVSIDRLHTLVGAGFGIALMLEGATGATYSGVTVREIHDADGPTRMNFRAHWRDDNSNPSIRPFLDMLRQRYPDLSGSSGPT